MELTNVLDVLSCPQCRASLEPRGAGVVCTGAPGHRFEVKDGFLTFAEMDPGKYEISYATRYAALWAFGYQTLHSGLDEPLYRSVSSLAAEVLATVGEPPVIVDAGCGVGRVAADCAALAPTGRVLALDGSLSMLDLARRIACGDGTVELGLDDLGFGTLSIRARGAANVYLARADVEQLPVAAAGADLALSINIVDRLPHGPEVAIKECHRVLKPGGHVIFTDPFNWTESWLWDKYGDRGAVLELFDENGFRIDTWYDDLWYQELLDSRGSVEKFRTLVVRARKP